MSDITAIDDTMPGVVTKNPAVLIHMTPELLERIDDYRYANRVPSRAEAMRFLIEWALNIHDSGKDMDHFKPER